MKSIVFIDCEIDTSKNKKLRDIGCVKADGTTFHKYNIQEFINFIRKAEFLSGHNFFHHDFQTLQQYIEEAGIHPQNFIDTLYLSPLLLPNKVFHSINKNDKLHEHAPNNPLQDAIKCKDLFYEEVGAFHSLPEEFQIILYNLLHDKREFSGFFRYIGFSIHDEPKDVETLIQNHFASKICEHVDLSKIISTSPVELAYVLSMIEALTATGVEQEPYVTPPWLMHNYPKVQELLIELRNTACGQSCSYCDNTFHAKRGLRRWFGHEQFRIYEGKPLQEQAVQAALQGKSMLVILPTGGGKSITFQLPALMSGESTRGLTVVISPLQSLMKDQIDNLEKQGITEAVTINGMIDTIERSKAIERIENGTAYILYIAPESLRSSTIEKLLLERNLVRFVIDEAHCFSAWGQDFRVDYLYIGKFIKGLQEKKKLSCPIPVSCLTATAKSRVIQDICHYFEHHLQIKLEIYRTDADRKNLKYEIINVNNQKEKYELLREKLISNPCPTIIYVSRTKKCEELASSLSEDGFPSLPYHGQMKTQEKMKSQEAFMKGEVQIIVATTAFGMGVDKKDIKMILHYDISDSLESYVQEAGRAGRDENLIAECVVFYQEEDLLKHFHLLNQSKLTLQEVRQIWKAVKEVTKFKKSIMISALELARKAGWDHEDEETLETRVKAAIAALEEADYVRRLQNNTKVFATGILTPSAQNAIEIIMNSNRFDEQYAQYATRIIKRFFSKKRTKLLLGDIHETQVQYVSDSLDIPINDVIQVINLMREEKILADSKDISAYIKQDISLQKACDLLEKYLNIEINLLKRLWDHEGYVNIKEIINDFVSLGNKNPLVNIKNILNFWSIKKWIERKRLNHPDLIHIRFLHKLNDLDPTYSRYHLAKFILEYLYKKNEVPSNHDYTDNTNQAETKNIVEFSMLEIKNAYEQANLIDNKTSFKEIEDALFLLSKIEILDIEGAFLVFYNRLRIEKIAINPNKNYTKENHSLLETHYKKKILQIHIVGEYARLMSQNQLLGKQFVKDYFVLDETAFIEKYFKDKKSELNRNITPKLYQKIFEPLSESQKKIISDLEGQYLLVLAGPGSGKTRVLVHKLASLLYMEEIKQEQLLMLTFSRAAATEFYCRLKELIGGSIFYIQIKTFHSFCFDLLGRKGNLEKSNDIIQNAIDAILQKEIEPISITKTVLVIDEAQDINDKEFELIQLLIKHNEDMRVIAVGDDDQNIFSFRGSSAEYLAKFQTIFHAKTYHLIENYRSPQNLVHFSNQFARSLSNRMKTQDILPVRKDFGRIHIVKYKHENIVVPLVHQVMNSNLKGTTCILTYTNDIAWHIVSLLKHHQVNAKLIQEQERFSLFNLSEVRSFYKDIENEDKNPIIQKETWNRAKQKLIQKFKRSIALPLVNTIIERFEEIYPQTRYNTDFKAYLHDSKLEDFYSPEQGSIIVSTIHKVKGKEFDNVFLALPNFIPLDNEMKRAFYVAITRAKQNLFIHLNTDFLDSYYVEGMEKTFDPNPYSPPEVLSFYLGLKDIYLDSCNHTQDTIKNLMSGDLLYVEPKGCKDAHGQFFLLFSKNMVENLNKWNNQDYEIEKAQVEFIVHWKKKGTNMEIIIPLPMLQLKKRKT